MKRTILYYPKIVIPPAPWLKQAVLYWDEVASIIPGIPPEEGGDWLNPEMAFLQNEGEFRAFRPEILRSEYDAAKEFDQEFRAIVEGPEFQERLRRERGELTARIHHTKVTEILYFEFLEPRELARPGPDYAWFLFEPNTAMLFVTLLVKYLADIDEHLTVVGTDHQIYEDFSFSPLIAEPSVPCLNAFFGDILPVPRDDVPLDDIVRFKQKRRYELLRFRQYLDDIGIRLSKAESKAQVKATIIAEKENLELGVKDLAALFRDSSIATIAGSLKSLISLKSPSLVGAAAVFADRAAELDKVPLEWGLAGIAGAGSIQLATYFIGRRNERRAALRESPFSYLNHAGLEGIVSIT